MDLDRKKRRFLTSLRLVIFLVDIAYANHPNDLADDDSLFSMNLAGNYDDANLGEAGASFHMDNRRDNHAGIRHKDIDDTLADTLRMDSRDARVASLHMGNLDVLVGSLHMDCSSVVLDPKGNWIGMDQIAYASPSLRVFCIGYVRLLFMSLSTFFLKKPNYQLVIGILLFFILWNNGMIGYIKTA